MLLVVFAKGRVGLVVVRHLILSMDALLRVLLRMAGEGGSGEDRHVARRALGESRRGRRCSRCDAGGVVWVVSCTFTRRERDEEGKKGKDRMSNGMAFSQTGDPIKLSV